jgi:protein phosphatase-4 regulatory subunit 3
VVIDEEDNQTLLVHRISADDIYRRQEDTIISWTDPEVATDLALSFQETVGCSFIWDQICSVQRSIHFPSVGGLESSARPLGDDLEHSGTSQDDGKLFYLCSIPVSRQLLWQLFLLLGKCVKRNLWLHSVFLSTDFC